MTVMVTRDDVTVMVTRDDVTEQAYARRLGR